MNKILMLFMILIPLFSINSQVKQQKEETIKRTIMILPFINKNDIKKYAYISDTVRDALKTKLLDGNNFTLTNFEQIDGKIKELNIPVEKSLDIIYAKQIAVKLRSDVVITGKYIIIEDSIMMQIDAYDIFTNQIVASTNIKGELGLDIFRIIDESANDMSVKLKTKLKEVKKSYFQEMSRILEKENFLKLSQNFGPINKAGTGLTSAGGVLFLAGAGILIFDLSYYYDRVKDNLYNNPRSESGYNDYLKTYYAYASLLAVSIVSVSLGSVLVGVGIPLIVYKKKGMTVSFDLNINRKPEIEISIKM